jgi:SAM-dependent methyltransferase
MDCKTHTARVQAHYLPLLAKHGDTNLAVDFQNAGNQQARFAILAAIDNLLDKSILDVGCGVGHFPAWLNERGYQGDYLGVDLLPEMVARAGKANPAMGFKTADILADPIRHRADYVMSSGIFHLGDQAYMHRMIAAMYLASRKGVAFNSLSSWDDYDTQGDFFCADPLETLKFCRTLTSQILMRHDYLPHDFTIFMFKD